MAVKTTDFTKTRQRLDKPSAPEKAMNPERRPHRWLWVLGVLLLVGMALGARYLINGSGNKDATQNNDDVVPGVVAYAFIDNAKDVRKLHILGKVVWIIKEGALVEKDAVLLKVEDTRERIQVERADADYEAAKVLVEEAAIAVKEHPVLIARQKNAVKAAELAAKIAEQAFLAAKRADELSGPEGSIIGKQQLNTAELNWERAKVLVDDEKEKQKQLERQDPNLKVRNAEQNRRDKKAQLDAAKYALGQCEVRAPEKGKVLKVNAHEGEWLTQNSQAHAIHFAPEGGLIARAEVLQEWADRVYVGQDVIMENDPRSQQQRWTSQVRSVSDMIGPKRHIQLEPFVFNDVRILECVIDIPQAATPQLRINQRVRVMFKTGTQ